VSQKAASQVAHAFIQWTLPTPSSQVISTNFCGNREMLIVTSVTGAWTWSKVYTCGNVPGPRHGMHSITAIGLRRPTKFGALLFLVCASVVYNNALWIYAGYGWKSCYLNDLFKFSFGTINAKESLTTHTHSTCLSD